MLFLAATLVGWIGGDFVYRKVEAKNMSPFDRAHPTSYSTLIETMRLSCSVFDT